MDEQYQHPELDCLLAQKDLDEVAKRANLVEELLAIGTALSGSQNLQQLLDLILSKSREITCSDAGSVYLVNRKEDAQELIFKTAQNDSISTRLFQEFAIPLTPKSLAGYVALTGDTLNIVDAYQLPSSVPYQLDRSFDQDFAYRTCSVLVLPMQNHEGTAIGVLQLINRKRQADLQITADNALEITLPFSQFQERIVRSLASQAAISIERNHLQQSIETLFEGFVKASVQVIEARDPTTSGHSERVAELTVRLAQEVNDVHSGPLHLIWFNDRQLKEIRYASLLHDFGKVLVPETILGKREKLYPEQLEVIRHRFALAQRTLEMECYQSKFKYLVEHPSHQHQGENQGENCPHCDRLTELDQELDRAIAYLKESLALIEDLKRPLAIETQELKTHYQTFEKQLQKIAQFTYRDVDGEQKPLLTANEIAQLLVLRGNLTPQERLAIEAHVTHSYEFLKRIPWTKGLQDIPAIAYGHHEKLDGTGYPQGLHQQDIPMQTQMMTVADIYDALTAADRPYKRRLPIDIVMKILHEEADNGKINPDLLLLFEQRQVFTALGHTWPPEKSAA
ncbi:GAF domain-containing protein [Roseofilum sp. BLCC_M91]|uniref:GAF domain-containing protein n=1 Tax=Roseofilum halophilum BLCC-M91 TaxID=3022259 RepID=A0ABT7BEG6_9CYAN|nr:HD family phosphohydrolase [Roseofilum halophilum]MDJ1177557.1 GAF domain-containing protein [Roseofilum halophilum BLCC-M91]